MKKKMCKFITVAVFLYETKLWPVALVKRLFQKLIDLKLKYLNNETK